MNARDLLRQDMEDIQLTPPQKLELLRQCIVTIEAEIYETLWPQLDDRGLVVDPVAFYVAHKGKLLNILAELHDILQKLGQQRSMERFDEAARYMSMASAHEKKVSDLIVHISFILRSLA